MSNELTRNPGQFDEVIHIIDNARSRAMKAVNAELIQMYWEIGAYVSGRVKDGGWGKSVVADFSEFLQAHYPGTKGFSAQNIWRMKQFYVFEFLDLEEPYKEKDLRRQIVSHLKDFILEFGHDFTFVGEEYRVQVGNTDFFIDLLFYNRALSCLVAIELKIDTFRPEHLGQLNFYLERILTGHYLQKRQIDRSSSA